jgi:hypothetical protein
VESRHKALDLRPAIANGWRLERLARRKNKGKAGGSLKQELTTVHEADSLLAVSGKAR